MNQSFRSQFSDELSVVVFLVPVQEKVKKINKSVIPGSFVLRVHTLSGDITAAACVTNI